MSIPDYQTIMLPLLEFAGDGQEHSLRDVVIFLAAKFGLTDEERSEMLPSGTQTAFYNRVGWARTYLKKAGLLESTRWGYFRITQRGKKTLKEDLTRIDSSYLKKYSEFIEFQAGYPDQKEVDRKTEKVVRQQTPEEEIEAAFSLVRERLSTDLLDNVMDCSPVFFERLVIDLLVQMGYGGTRKDAGQAIGGAGDEGIDGIIKEDRLGLDIVYIQAKRWENAVARPEIQKFAGALQGKRAKKGIFITTSSFTAGSKEYVRSIDSKIVLIDGEMLAQLMMDFNIGVGSVTSYELKRINSDYFSDV